MKQTQPLPTTARIYISAVSVIGLTVVAVSLYALHREPVRLQWFLLAGLTLLSGSFTIRIPTIPARLSVSETFVFAAVLLFGPSAATIIVVLDSLVISLWLNRRSQSLSRVMFNMAAPSVAIWTASTAFYFLAGISPLYRSSRSILTLLGPLVVLAFVYFLLNSFLIAFAVAFEKRLSTYTVWRNNFFWLSLNYFSGASVAALLLPYLQRDQQEFAKVIGVFLPLLLISYLTFKTAMGRADDANRHLAQLNQLYLSTIETLAMAIDAKDQITHGHIRRVQLRAVRLAAAMGVTDERQIRAIEAAALLHDMGKLAVPEYILNKPGPLTAPEFDKMKLHASIGADILSAIEFPYPVVPIVRHHHENWDGSGYPDGLCGSDIPIGARILSVVDCFDALTSDRPYRPRLSDTDALKIITARRSSMYDPLVVDTFLKAHSAGLLSIDTTEERLPLSLRELGSIETEPAPPAHGLDNISSSSEEMVALFELARDLNKGSTFKDISDTAISHLRRLIPSSLACIYLKDSSTEELLCVRAAGSASNLVADIRIPLGQRLTGWVVANRQTIRNSDPVLDIGEASRTISPRLTNCLSTPLIVDNSVIGALSLYTNATQGFTEEDRRLLEVVALQVAPALLHSRNAETVDGPARTSPLLSGFGTSLSLPLYPFSPTIVTYVEVERVESIHPRIGRDTHDAIVVWLGSEIPNPHFVLRLREGEFAILSSITTEGPAALTATAVRDRLELFLSSISNNCSFVVTAEAASAPTDGEHLEELIEAARKRARSGRGPRGVSAVH